MSKRHLKRINAPKSWPIERKNKFWITRPNPGPHSFNKSLPLSVIFTELLKYTLTTKEVKSILKQGNVLVNGKSRVDYKFPVGVLDVLEFPEDEYYRLLFNERGKFSLKKIDKKEKETIFFKVANKKIIKKNKLQLNFDNGNNVLTDNKDVKTNDVVLLEKDKIKEVLKFEKGAFVYLIGGRHVGASGKLEKIEDGKIVFGSGKEKLETLKKYAYVVGKDKSLIDLKNE